MLHLHVIVHVKEEKDLDDKAYRKKVNDLAADIQCGPSLARDLLILAGNNAQLVRDASMMCTSAESMKAYIIDRRFKQIEQ